MLSLSATLLALACAAAGAAASAEVSLDHEDARPVAVDGLGEGVSSKASEDDVYVKASLFVAQTSLRRFTAEMDSAFLVAVAEVCGVQTGDVKIDRKSDAKDAKPTTSRRLMQDVKTEDDGVIVDLSIKVKDHESGMAVISIIKQATVGGVQAKLAARFSEECSKHDTIDAQFEPIVTIHRALYVLGGLPHSTDVTSGELPKWCKKYGKKADDKLFVKWTKEQCTASWGTHEQILKNIEGVICICRGQKLLALAPDPVAPDMQVVSVVRTRAHKKGYNMYSMQIRSGITVERPTPELGMSVTLEFSQAVLGKNSTHHRVHFSLNRVLEYQALDGKGLTEETTERMNYAHDKHQQGRACDDGAKNKALPGSNCVAQDFFLDKFQPAVVTKEGSSDVIRIASDLQGSAPWCRLENGGKGCPKPPDYKPSISFMFKFDPADFKNVHIEASVDTFPYKFSNSTLSLRGKMYSHTMMASINSPDSSLTANTLVDCTVLPLPQGCPYLRMNGGVQLSWAQRVSNVMAGNSTKVAASLPEEITKSSSAILPVNSPDNVDASSATAKSIFFSFQHQKAISLQWKPALSVRNLPEIPYNFALRLTAPCMLVLGFQIALMMFGQF